MRNALTIAGSDSCGGAGIQADLKSFSANGVYGMSVITAVTAQNTQGVTYVQDLEPYTIEQQIRAIFDDISVDSVKIGMVSQIASIEIIAHTLNEYPLPPIVLDPVMVSKSGYKLLSPGAQEALVQLLFPMATLITPNIPEAEAILGTSIDTVDSMKDACIRLHHYGSGHILLKGGHLSDSASDVYFDGKEFFILEEKRIPTTHTHGTGCTFSSAIAAHVSRGFGMKESITRSKKYVTAAIEHGFKLGKGVGPTHHFYSLYQKSGLYKNIEE